MLELAALAASTLLFGLVIFQWLLIIGKPLGKFAWGGKHAILPTPLRVASAFSIILYGWFALIILSHAGVTSVFTGEWVGLVCKILSGYFFLGVLMNAISRSKAERNVMTPLASLLALLFLYVAIYAGRS
jgi:hypothetical protein